MNEPGKSLVVLEFVSECMDLSEMVTRSITAARFRGWREGR